MMDPELRELLYDIDDRAEDDLPRRAELRRSESRAVLDELYAWLCDQATLTSLSIGKAAAYTLSNWDRLTRFVDDPRIPVDNNATEVTVRPTCADSHAAVPRPA